MQQKWLHLTFKYLENTSSLLNYVRNWQENNKWLNLDLYITVRSKYQGQTRSDAEVKNVDCKHERAFKVQFIYRRYN